MLREEPEPEPELELELEREPAVVLSDPEGGSEFRRPFERLQ